MSNNPYNAKSSELNIFPISFDRSSETIYKRKEDYESLPSYERLTDDEKVFVGTHATLPSESINDELTNIYEEASALSPKTTHYNGRILSENNIAKIINSLSDFHNYVISHTYNADGDQISFISFMIKGRYFEYNPDPELGSNYIDSELWVAVEFANSDAAFEYLHAWDENDDTSDKIKGINFYNSCPYSDKNPKPGNIELLQLTEKLPGVKVRVPYSSKYQIETKRIKNINGGYV